MFSACKENPEITVGLYTQPSVLKSKTGHLISEVISEKLRCQALAETTDWNSEEDKAKLLFSLGKKAYRDLAEREFRAKIIRKNNNILR